MSEPWFILTKRFGDDVRNPSARDIRDAIGEVTNPAYAADAEHH